MCGIFLVASPAEAKHGWSEKREIKAEILQVVLPFPPSLTIIDTFTGPALHSYPWHHSHMWVTGQEHSPDNQWGRQWGQLLARTHTLLCTIVILWLSL